MMASLAYDATGSYTMIFAVFALLAACGSVLVFLARPPVLATIPSPPGRGLP
jgi:hypothetical protein